MEIIALIALGIIIFLICKISKNAGEQRVLLTLREELSEKEEEIIDLEVSRKNDA